MNKTTSVDKCAAAFVDGIEHRKKTGLLPGLGGSVPLAEAVPVDPVRRGPPILKTAGGQVRGKRRRSARMDAEVAALGRSTSAYNQELEKS